MKKDKLEGILAGTVPLVEAIFYKNSAPNTTAERIMGPSEPLINNSFVTPYVGNFPESFAIPAISGLIGDFVQKYGEKRGNRVLQKLGQFFPEVSATAISLYFTLGETVLPQILPGCADIRDVPAVLVSALAGYTLAKIGRRSGFNERIYALSREAS